MNSAFTAVCVLCTLVAGCSGSLIFSSISSGDSGNYTCEAMNEELNAGETGSLYDVQVTTSGLQSAIYGSEIKHGILRCPLKRCSGRIARTARIDVARCYRHRT